MERSFSLAPQDATEALRAFLSAMHELATAHNCHGWQMQIFAAEGGPEWLHVPAIEASLVRIEDFQQSGQGDNARASYRVNEVAHMFFGADGAVMMGGGSAGQENETC